MIIYKPKTIKRRRSKLKRLITYLTKLRRGKFNIKDNSYRNWERYYSWCYARDDIRSINQLIKNGDLTASNVPTIIINSSLTFKRIEKIFKIL